MCENIPKAKHGYSRDGRPDCRQVVIALVVTTDGLPLAYEVFAGNTADKTTLKEFLAKIERLYGPARRVWVMDRGIPTQATLADMRAESVAYLVGTPKSLLAKLERELLDKPWEAVHAGMAGKLLEKEGELYVQAKSNDRQKKETAMPSCTCSQGLASSSCSNFGSRLLGVPTRYATPSARMSASVACVGTPRSITHTRRALP